MQKKFKNSWRRFADELSKAEISDAISLREQLISFLRSNLESLSQAPLSDYGLPKIAALNFSSIPSPSTISKDEVSSLVKKICQHGDRSINGIGQLLRDVLETLSTLESSEICPRCESYGMQVFKGQLDNKLVLQCRHCGMGVYLDGSPIGRQSLVFPSTDDLKSQHLN